MECIVLASPEFGLYFLQNAKIGEIMSKIKDLIIIFRVL